MNFFEQQDIAKRNTLRLVILLVLAVASLIAITCAFVAVIFYYFIGNNPALAYQTSGSLLGNIWRSLSWPVVAGIAGVIGSVTCLGALFKYSQLRGGGRTVAAAMGGKLIAAQTQNPDERKILNVVEEMAIASGTAVPPVYVIEDAAINAFAAGFHPQDAVIGITRGSIQQLSRDELQGVIAHEFSHIFHGDMRLNMRLVAILHGILIIGLLGSFLMRSGSHRTLASRSNSKNSQGGIVILGLGLFAIGYTGIFFGNLIKAAVSRQREFLADASAVQFTRNPEGIAGALKKIGASAYGSQLQQENAAEFSHMYFGQGVKSFLGLMATHPPLETRIRRILPRWDGKFTSTATPAADAAGATHANTSANSQHASALSTGALSTGASATNALATGALVAAQIEQIAQPNQAHIHYAQQTLQQLPATLKAASGEPFSARALVFGLLLSPHCAATQWQQLQPLYSAEELQQLQPLAEQAQRLGNSLRLPLLELCLPSLKQLSQTQCEQFLQALKRMINSDTVLRLPEWLVYRSVRHHLQPPTSAPAQLHLRQLRNECQLILSLLAHAGGEQAEAAFNAAATALHMGQLQLQRKNQLQLDALEEALIRLNQIKPLQKPSLLKALGECVLYDKHIRSSEAEVLRAIADSLDCPLPPFLAQS